MGAHGVVLQNQGRGDAGASGTCRHMAQKFPLSAREFVELLVRTFTITPERAQRGDGVAEMQIALHQGPNGGEQFVDVTALMNRTTGGAVGDQQGLRHGHAIARGEQKVNHGHIRLEPQGLFNGGVAVGD